MADMTIAEALAYARTLAAGDNLTPTAARAMLGHVVGKGSAWLLAHREVPLSAEQAEQFRSLARRAAGGEPLAQLTGQREFYGLPFTVTPDVLIPRPETEAIVDALLAWVRMHQPVGGRLVDVGSGSGAIAVACAAHLPDVHVTAVELSREALEIARHNARRNGVADRMTFVQGDLLDALAGPFDAIAANLPYINADELAALDVGRWEPRIALDGGPDGLTLVKQLLAQAPSRLAQPGLLLLEIGHDQGARVERLARSAFPLAAVTVQPDLAKLDRIVRVEVG